MITPFIKSFFMSRPSKKLKYYIEIMNWFYNRHNKFFAKYYCRKILYKFGCEIMPGIIFSSLPHFPHVVGIVIGTGVRIGNNVTIFQNVTLGRNISGNAPVNHNEMPTIEDNVRILSGAVIAGKITIGHNSMIAANAVVTKNVPPYSLVVGFNQIKALPENQKI